MVIVNSKAGQLANRLIHFSHFMASSMEHGYRLIYPYFEEYESLFPATFLNRFNGYNISIRLSRFRLFHRMILLVFRYLSYLSYFTFRNVAGLEFLFIRDIDRKGEIFDLNQDRFVQSAKDRIVFAYGWRFRDQINFTKHASQIRGFFEPDAPYLEKVDSAIRQCNRVGKALVGVHIRKGDYRTFKGGKWFHSDEIYRRKMEDMRKILKSQGKECVFLVASNEPVKDEYFKGLPVVTGEREAVVDLYALSRCDYLIGPPSTFTIWASFYGEVPLLMLSSRESAISLEHFRIMNIF